MMNQSANKRTEHCSTEDGKQALPTIQQMPSNHHIEDEIEAQIKTEATPLLGIKCNDENSEEVSTQSGPGSTSSSQPVSKWTIGTIMALASAMLVQSFLLVSVFPYAGFLAMRLVPSVNEENAGRYAGLIGSSFMFGRMFTSYIWGKAADRLGRKFVLEASLCLSTLFSILFGLAPTLPLALAARFALGLSNNLLGVIQTLVMELSNGDKSAETRGNAIIMGAWGYGFLLNPALGGYLADPMSQYPDSKLFVWLDSFLNMTEYPFLLPNLVGGVFCLVACFLVSSFVEETLPSPDRVVNFRWDIKLKKALGSEVEAPTKENSSDTASRGGYSADTWRDKNGLSRWNSMSSSETGRSHPPSPPSKPFDVSQPNEKKETATIKSLLKRPATRKHLILYWIYSFLMLMVDETFPLYCMSKDSGLGVVEKMIGNLLSGAGAFYLLLQFFLLTTLVDRYGLYNTMKIGAFFSIPMVILLPLTLITNRGGEEGKLTWCTFVFVSVVYAVLRACTSVTIMTISMTTNRTVPAHQRATMNGLSTMGGSVVKAAGPVFAGLLFSESVKRISPPIGSVFVWTVISFMGLGFFVQTLMLTDRVPEDDDQCV